MAATQYPFTASGGVGDTQLAPNTAAGLSAMRVAHATYSFAVDGGVTGAITPVSTAVLPNKAIIYDAVILASTAVTSTGSATVAVGTTAGSAANSIMAATAKASLGVGVFGQSAPVPQTSSTFVKMSAAGSINITVGTADLTAGILEIFVFYVVSPS